MRKKMNEGEMGDDRGVAMKVEDMVCVLSPCRRQVLIFMRVSILVCVMAVMVVRVVFFGERSL